MWVFFTFILMILTVPFSITGKRIYSLTQKNYLHKEYFKYSIIFEKNKYIGPSHIEISETFSQKRTGSDQVVKSNIHIEQFLEGTKLKKPQESPF